MAVITNAGLNLMAAALQTVGAPSPAITYVDIVPAAGILASPITSGTPISAITITVGLPGNIGAGQGMTITDGTNTETVTVAAGGVLAGATSIPINSWTPAHTYAANTTAIACTPFATDISIYNGAAAGQRVSANAGSAGANPGESLNSAYFDGTQPTNIYMAVGFWGGSTATATPGSGTLIAVDLQYWNHTLNADSASYQLDSTL